MNLNRRLEKLENDSLQLEHSFRMQIKGAHVEFRLDKPFSEIIKDLPDTTAPPSERGLEKNES